MVLSSLPEWASKALSEDEEEAKQEEEEADRGLSPEFVLRAGQFEVVLLVDTGEVAGGEQGGKKNRKAVTAKELQKAGVRHEVRRLNVGDFVWVARGVGGAGVELVLPHVVERKRADDLISSIRDQRYKEQKWRLSRCGVPNAIYVIEEFARCRLEKYGGSMQAKDTALITTACTKG